MVRKNVEIKVKLTDKTVSVERIRNRCQQLVDESSSERKNGENLVLEEDKGWRSNDVWQRDVFFNTVKDGQRLKLRLQQRQDEVSKSCELIGYERPDVDGRREPKLSTFTIYRTKNDMDEEVANLEAVLAVTLGRRGEVVKRRHVYIVGRQYDDHDDEVKEEGGEDKVVAVGEEEWLRRMTRIHLDIVDGLDQAYVELEVQLNTDEANDIRLEVDLAHRIARQLMSKLDIDDCEQISCAYVDLISC